MTSTKDLAIKSALSNDWPQAVKFNEELLVENSRDLSALNRLAFAFIKLGKYEDARKTYKKVIEIDRTNPIAMKNLKRVETMSSSKSSKKNGDSTNNPQAQIIDVFIEEAGKTKTVDLINLADKKTLSMSQPGDNVQLIIKRSKVFIQNGEKEYLGMLPDNVGVRLINFMKGGNEYSACIKALEEKNVKVFIKETKRASKFKNQPSFILTSVKAK